MKPDRLLDNILDNTLDNVLDKSCVLFATCLVFAGPVFATQAPAGEPASRERGVPVADVLYTNGRIVTVDSDFSIAEAFAVAADEFVAVGTEAEVRQYAGDRTQIVDLGGRTVVPGFIDGHAHMDREGLKHLLPSLAGARSIGDILTVVRDQVEAKRPGEWIVTMPVGEPPTYASGATLLAEGRFPNRHDLDRVAPENPVYIKGIWYWWSGKPPIVSIANSEALRRAGIDRDTKAPYPGIEIERDARGEPTGVFRENGIIGTLEYSLMDAAPRFEFDDRVRALRDSMRRYNAVGTTSVYEGHGVAPAIVRAYKKLWENDELTVRSHLVMSPTWDASPAVSIEKPLRDWAAYAGGRGLGDEWLTISGIHAAAGSSAAYDIRRRSSDNPGWAGYSTDSGLPADRGTLEDLFLAAAKAGLRVNAITHTAELLEAHLAALEAVDARIPIAGRRFVLQHLSFVSDEQIRRIKALGIVPTFIPGKTVWSSGRARTQDLPAAEADTYVPLKAFLDHGVRFALATDNVPIDPLHTLGAAVSRHDRDSAAAVVPEQRISARDALRAFTIDAAYLSFEENRKGSIEVGKLADFAVLSDDLLTAAPGSIREIQVLMTVVGGEIVHSQNSEEVLD